MNEKFPVNVKQVGDIDENLKIYLEDNVLNYLFEYAKKAGYDERIALLLGKKNIIDGKSVIFIDAAILGKYSEELNNILIPSEKTEDYIKQQLGIHFEDMEIIGLMQSQPGYGTYLNPSYKGYMNQNFKKEHQVLFTIDPLEKAMTFYIRNKDGDLKESAGFIVYYEKNNQMLEYIEENPIEADFIMPKSVKIEKDFLEDYESEDNINEKFIKLKNKKSSTFERNDKPINVKKILKNSMSSEKSYPNKTNNILIAISSIVIVVTAILAGALINSEGRISALERDIEIITNSHIALIQSLQATQEAFAFMQIPEAALIIEDGTTLAEPVIVHESAAVQSPATNEPSGVPVVASGQTYIVQPGDSLISISNMFFGENRIYDIMYLNEIEDANTIFAGMLLVIPY